MKASQNIYHLPFNTAVDIRPAPSHFEQRWQKNAVDFALDVGTPILAAGDGLVQMVIDGYDQGGLREKYLHQCNLVVIRHLHGENTWYAHLKKGIPLNEGQQIQAEEMIGPVGLSGYTGYPHLHYQTTRTDRGALITIPTRFKIGGKVQILVSPR